MLVLTTTRAKRIGIVLPPTRGAWDGKSTAAPIVWKENAQYHMLYQGWSSGGGPREFGLATSKDGTNWLKYDGNPVMKPSKGTWDGAGFECGSLLRHEDEYWLYYTGIGADGMTRVGLATSGDLKSWDKHDGNPILDIDTTNNWESQGVAFPAVVQGTDSYRMIYGGYGPDSMQLGLAHSADGIDWTKHTHNPVLRQRGWFADPECDHWDAGIEVHQTLAIGDFFVMLYEGLGNFPHRYNLGVAYSPDCASWARNPENPIFPLTGPNVKQDMSTVHPWLLIDDMILYYVEVVGANTHAEHRICAARIDPDLLNPLAQRSLSYPLWVDRRIGASGGVTSAIPCMGFGRKSFYIVSTMGGRIIVEIDPAGLSQWFVHFEDKVLGSKVWEYTTSHGFERVRLRFMPSGEAKISAWLVLEKS